jgi:glucokinase
VAEAVVVAVDVGGTTIKSAVLDSRGRATDRAELPTPVADGHGSPAAIVDHVVGLVERASRDHGSVAAVGLGVPGWVDDDAGVAKLSANLGWTDVSFRSLTAAATGLPVAFGHDVRLGAVGEGLVGAARGASDFLFVTLGTGVGAAVVIGGVPYRGSAGMGGELGHIVVEPDGPACGCGKRGCVEAVASAASVVRAYAAATGVTLSGAAAVVERVRAGDEQAGAVWTRAVDALGLAIAHYVVILDPAVVVVGGGMAAAEATLFDPLLEVITAQVGFRPPPPIVAGTLGPWAGCIGAGLQAWRLAGASDDDFEPVDRLAG